MSMSTITNESASASAAPQATASSVNPRQALFLRLFHLLPTLATFALPADERSAAERGGGGA